MRRSIYGAVAAASALTLLTGGIALADNVHNDVTVGGSDTITAGGSTTVNYRISATGVGNDGQAGCNASDGSAATLTITAPPGVTASPSSLVFTTCGTHQSVTFSSSAVGNHNIAHGVSDSGVGTYTTTQANWTLTVNAAPVVTPADTTPPVLNLPANITTEATSASGAAVTYSATADDNKDGAVTPSCSPASDSTFSLGTTTVNCSATDAAGNTSTGSFTVTVEDTTAPTLSNMPGNQTAVATTSSGAAVMYTNPTAADAVDANPSVSCSPASGDNFRLGETTVSCTAKDAANNTSAASTFTVTVQYASSKVLQPINADGFSKFKLNSTIPLKIKLSGASAGIENAVITQSTSKLTNNIWGDELEAPSTATPHSGTTLRYDAASDQYIFNLATKPLGTGTFRVTLDLGGGKTETAEFSIVK
jgi:hypothetical protein